VTKALPAAALVFALLLGFASPAGAFGSVQSRSFQSMLPGEVASFKILFYNLRQNRTINLSLSASAPPGWEVALSEDFLSLPFSVPNDYSSEDGIEYVSSRLGDIKARPVFVSVRPPPDAAGEHTVRVVAKEIPSGGGIRTLQQRSFSFRVSLSGNPQSILLPREEGSNASGGKTYISGEPAADATGDIAALPAAGRYVFPATAAVLFFVYLVVRRGS
jgi:hypothetical protein